MLETAAFAYILTGTIACLRILLTRRGAAQAAARDARYAAAIWRAR